MSKRSTRHSAFRRPHPHRSWRLSVIAAALITGLNSDLPCQLVAQVTEVSTTGTAGYAGPAGPR